MIFLKNFFQGLIPHDSDTKRLAEDLDSNTGNVILSMVDLSSNSLIFFSMLLSISLINPLDNKWSENIVSRG